LYLDDDHVSDAGARPIVNEIVKQLAAKTGGARRRRRFSP
jgi:hypothetical protein